MFTSKAPQATRQAASNSNSKGNITMNSNRKFGSNRHNVARKVVRLRTKELLSWQAIADQLDIAPRTARKLFQERTGEHQHHDHLPSKGGRFPAQWDVDAEVAPYLPGTGEINEWHKRFGADLETVEA